MKKRDNATDKDAGLIHSDRVDQNEPQPKTRLDSYVLPPDQQPPILVQVNFRAPVELLEDIDAWMTELNAARRWPKLKRSDIIRGALEWAVRNKPDLEK